MCGGRGPRPHQRAARAALSAQRLSRRSAAGHGDHSTRIRPRPSTNAIEATHRRAPKELSCRTFDAIAGTIERLLRGPMRLPAGSGVTQASYPRISWIGAPDIRRAGGCPPGEQPAPQCWPPPSGRLEQAPQKSCHTAAIAPMAATRRRVIPVEPRVSDPRSRPSRPASRAPGVPGRSSRSGARFARPRIRSG